MNKPNGSGGGKGKQPPNMRILGQHIRDLSFENFAFRRGKSVNVVPDMQIHLNVDAKGIQGKGMFEVLLKLNIDSREKDSGERIFLLEIEYAGIIQAENAPDSVLQPFLLVECPRLMFPFLRRIISDITHEGGFPSFHLNVIDFTQLLHNELEKSRSQQAKKANA